MSSCFLPKRLKNRSGGSSVKTGSEDVDWERIWIGQVFLLYYVMHSMFGNRMNLSKWLLSIWYHYDITLSIHLHPLSITILYLILLFHPHLSILYLSLCYIYYLLYIIILYFILLSLIIISFWYHIQYQSISTLPINPSIIYTSHSIIPF